MKTRTVILIFGGVLFLNVLIALGFFLWVKVSSGAAQARKAETRSSNAFSPTDFSVPDATAAWAEFDSPQDGEAVERKFPVSGRCRSLPPGSRLMLVVDSGNNIYSPKLPPLTVEGESWHGKGNEYGVPRGGKFSACLFVVSEEGFERISEWQAQGKATGKWPPFRGGVPGAVELTRVPLRVAHK